MKSGALLPSNLPSVIDRSNLSPSREESLFVLMTRGKLLGNDAPLFIFISILIMTQLISFLHVLLTAVRTRRLGILPIKIYRGNNAVFVPVEYGWLNRGKESSHIRNCNIFALYCHNIMIRCFHYIFSKVQLKSQYLPLFWTLRTRIRIIYMHLSLFETFYKGKRV